MPITVGLFEFRFEIETSKTIYLISGDIQTSKKQKTVHDISEQQHNNTLNNLYCLQQQNAQLNTPLFDNQVNLNSIMYPVGSLQQPQGGNNNALVNFNTLQNYANQNGGGGNDLARYDSVDLERLDSLNSIDSFGLFDPSMPMQQQVCVCYVETVYSFG